MRSIRNILLSCALCVTAVPALASGPDAQSSGSIRVEITIPPFTQALAASRAGAVGLWTVRTNTAPVMLNLPHAVGEQETEASFFAGDGDLVTALVEEGAFSIVSSSVAPSRGLNRSVFVLRRTGTARPNDRGVLLFATI